jgi:hypothetical protein
MLTPHIVSCSRPPETIAKYMCKTRLHNESVIVKLRAVGFPSVNKSSVCWDPLQTFGGQVRYILERPCTQSLRDVGSALRWQAPSRSILAINK